MKTKRSPLHDVAALASLLALTACEEEFDPGSEITKMRVLAVQADSPFASPGESVRLEALSYDPEARPISWAWAVCADPASSSVEGCLANVALNTIETGEPPLLGMGEGQSGIDLMIAANAIERIPVEARAQAYVGVLSVACPGNLELAANGTSPLLPFRCSEADTGRELGTDEAIVGIKRVFLRQAERNQNPVIQAIRFDGEDWAADDVKEVAGCDIDDSTYDDCPSDTKHRIQALVDPASFETGSDEFGRSFDEQLIVQQYTEAGIVEEEIRIATDSETGWAARASASGRELRLWFVARDDRGGVSWAERRVRVR